MVFYYLSCVACNIKVSIGTLSALTLEEAFFVEITKPDSREGKVERD
jgi:hypothetical protein